MVMTPLVAAPPVPTLTVNAVVPLLLGIEGLVPKPEAMVGAVEDIKSLEVLKAVLKTLEARWVASPMGKVLSVPG
jgi:hypothetical protein